MKPENVDIALAMARIAGKIRGQKCKVWVVKDLGIEPIEHNPMKKYLLRARTAAPSLSYRPVSLIEQRVSSTLRNMEKRMLW
jgi:hypothetical protein